MPCYSDSDSDRIRGRIRTQIRIRKKWFGSDWPILSDLMSSTTSHGMILGGTQDVMDKNTQYKQ